MKLLKNIYITIAVCGFILVYGTAGASDFEMETGQILMTDAQFYLRMFISFLTFIGGAIGVKVCNAAMQRKRRYKSVQIG